MSILSHSDFFDAVKRFCILQSELQEKFIEKNSISNDWKYLTDLPRRGDLSVRGEKWNYVRHGLGVRFVGESGIVIDVHRDILNRRVVDAHRVCEYILSVTNFEVDGVDIYQRCVEYLRGMEKGGLLKKMDADGEAWLLI